MQVNRIASIYGKENIENYVKENVKNGNLLETDKNKAPIWFTSRGLQLPKLVQTLIGALDSDILLNSREKVNRKNSVSRKKIVDGEDLSEKQQEGALRTFDKIMREKNRDFEL